MSDYSNYSEGGDTDFSEEDNYAGAQGCFIVISSLVLYAYVRPGLTLLHYREEVHIIGLVAPRCRISTGRPPPSPSPRPSRGAVGPTLAE